MLTSVDNLILWLDKNNLTEWSLRTAKQNDPNSYVFKSDPTQDKQLEIQRMRDVLDLSVNSRLYVSAKTNKGGTTGNFSEILEAPQAAPVAAPATQTIGYTPDELERRITQAVERTNFEWQKKQFEQDRKDFEEARKEFEEKQNGIFGILIEKAAPVIMPYIQGFLQKKNPLAQVAGLEQPYKADPIPVKENTAETAEQQEKEVFTDEESEKLFALMERFKKVEPDYLTLVESVVVMAESGDSMYMMAKKMLLNK
ncbi:MAG: hypothetical protein ACI30B_07575 [Paludibacteraceae bacterium]